MGGNKRGVQRDAGGVVENLKHWDEFGEDRKTQNIGRKKVKGLVDVSFGKLPNTKGLRH